MIPIKSRKNLPRLLVGAALLACTPAHADVVANFTGDTAYDQYTGVAGGGWTNGWANTGSNIPTASVINTTPINGSGNYLSVNPNGTADGGIGRAFDGTGAAGGVDATAPVTFNFDLRIDSLSGFDTATDYLSVHASTGGTANYNVSSFSSFIIRAYGASVSSKNANEWLLYNGAGDGGGFNAANFVNSGMTLNAGTTYHFTITNYAATEKYDVSIFDGTSTVSQTGLGWRANAGTNLQTNLAFNNRESSTADTFGYSLDNISVVPEPSTYGLMGAGALAAVALVRRRRKDAKLAA